MNIRFKEKGREKHYFPVYFTISTFNRSSNYSSQEHLVFEHILEFFSGNMPRSSTQYLSGLEVCTHAVFLVELDYTNMVSAQAQATHLSSPSLSFHIAPKHVPSVTSFSTLQELSCPKVCVTASHHVYAFPVFPHLCDTTTAILTWEESSNASTVGFSLAKSFPLNSCMENWPLVLGHAQEREKEELEFSPGTCWDSG